MEHKKEVRFDIYCSKCKYRDLEENIEPCWDCLTEPVNVDSRKPVNFEEAKNENTNSGANI